MPGQGEEEAGETGAKHSCFASPKIARKEPRWIRCEAAIEKWYLETVVFSVAKGEISLPSLRKEDLQQWARDGLRGWHWATGGMVSYRTPTMDFSPTKMTDSILERGNPCSEARAFYLERSGLCGGTTKWVERSEYSERKGNSLRQPPSYMGALSNVQPQCLTCNMRILTHACMLRMTICLGSPRWLYCLDEVQSTCSVDTG